MKSEELKKIVKEKYGEIASASLQVEREPACGCGCSNETNDYSILADDYSHLDGYNPDADLYLGCGIPTEFAGIGKGNHVLDLGSGAGNDCFVARSLVGPEGRVTGLDFTDTMVEKARLNLEKTGFKNIEFIKGDIEDMPLPADRFDVVISNCVLNLVPDKQKAFSEIYRVLKPGGHFCISDIVLEGNLPEKIRRAAEMYAGCVSGAMQKSEYLDVISRQGFSAIEIKQYRKTEIPEPELLKVLSPEEAEKFRNSEVGIYSITVTGLKTE